MSVTSCSRFQILRLHSSGGLGEVYVAMDSELEREVALKKIRGRHADDPESRERFLREAVITGALEHPGIVPVYGLGEYEDGRPFYAMRLIRGETLKEAVDRFHHHGASGREDAEATLELRQLLGRLIAVCNAVAYAHSHGILHRDLKPENIMLGSFGETLVVDWGIAKECGIPEEAPQEVERSISDDPDESTLVGLTLGTPQYMSPEQAAGRLALLTPASDVYSLGATLYYILSGRPPFAGVDTDLIPILVQEGDYPPPRRINPQVSAALEAICLKAMARKPEARYASARALADDLEHWLADDAVAAHVEPWLERAGRWSRRHKGAVGLISATTMLAVTVSIAWILLAGANERHFLEQQRADRMEEFAREKAQLQHEAEIRRHEAEDQSTRAERNEALARRYLYFSRINLADRAWQEAQIQTMLSLLEEERTTQKDLLGFEWRYLWRLQHSSLLTLEGHSQSVQAVACSPDGSKVASAAEDRIIRVWDAKTGRRICTFRKHEGGVNSIAFSPDGRYLASASDDGTARIWEVVDQTERRHPNQETIFRAHPQIVRSVAFSHDGRHLASGSRDLHIHVWDASALRGGEVREPLYNLIGHQSPVNCLAFSPDDKLLASAGGDSSEIYKPGEVKFWDLKERREIPTSWEHAATVEGLAFSPEGKRLATGSADRSVKIWDVSNIARGGPIPTLHTLRGHSKGVLSVAFSPDGKEVASASEDRTIKIWDAIRGVEALTLRGHMMEVTSVAFCPAGARIVSGSKDSTVRIWDATASHETLTLQGHGLDVNHVAFSPGGDLLATASDDKTLKLWDATTGRELRTFVGHQAGVNSVTFCQDGKWLVSGGQDGLIIVWNPSTGQPVQTIKTDGGIINALIRNLDGKHLATSHHDGAVRVWDVASDGLIKTAASRRLSTVSRLNVACVCYSPHGRCLAAGSEDGTLRVWETASGAEIRRIRASDAKIFGVAFSPDGLSLAAACGDGTVRLCDPATGALLRTFRGHARMVTSVTFSPDGRRIASGSDDQNVKLWDPATGEQALTLKGHRETITSLTFSPDGNRLASSCDDWTVKVWNAMPPDTIGRPLDSNLLGPSAAPNPSQER